MIKSLLMSVVLAAGLILSTPAIGQQQAACAKRADIVKHMHKKYKEAPVAIGLANNGGVLETLVGPKGKSWTIIITMPSGKTCMVAAGENWERIPQKATTPEGTDS